MQLAQLEAAGQRTLRQAFQAMPLTQTAASEAVAPIMNVQEVNQPGRAHSVDVISNLVTREVVDYGISFLGLIGPREVGGETQTARLGGVSPPRTIRSAMKHPKSHHDKP